MHSIDLGDSLAGVKHTGSAPSAGVKSSGDGVSEGDGKEPQDGPGDAEPPPESDDEGEEPQEETDGDPTDDEGIVDHRAVEATLVAAEATGALAVSSSEGEDALDSSVAPLRGAGQAN